MKNWELDVLAFKLGEILRRKLKKVENLEMSTLGRGIWQKTENHGK